MTSHDLTTLGDSQTDPSGLYGVMPGNTWPSMLSKRLNASNALTVPRIFGIGGQITSQFLGRADVMYEYSTPSVVIIYGGVNDPGDNVTGTAQAGSTNTITLAAGTTFNTLNAFVGDTITLTGGTGSGQTKTIIAYSGSTLIATVDSNWTTPPDNTSTYSKAATTQAQQQANHQAIIKAMKYRACGNGAGLGTGVSFWNQASLPANGSLGQRYVILQDNSTIGGVSPNHPNQHANISGNYSASPQQTVWEWRNAQAGELGWGRVAIAGTTAFSDGVSRVMTMGSNYLNWTASAGDNYNVTTGAGTQFATYVPVRAAASAAAAAEGTVYCDMYAFQSMLIYGGTFLGNTIISETTQGSNSWHYTANNQHHNTYGHDTVARSLYYAIVANGWLSTLSI